MTNNLKLEVHYSYLDKPSQVGGFLIIEKQSPVGGSLIIDKQSQVGGSLLLFRQTISSWRFTTLI